MLSGSFRVAVPPLEARDGGIFSQLLYVGCKICTNVYETLAEICERFVDETFLCLERRSRGTFMNKRVLRIRPHSSLEWHASVLKGVAKRQPPLQAQVFKSQPPFL